MADGTVQTVTPSKVRADLDFALIRPYTAAAALTKGEAVYPSAADTAALARANAAATSRAIGIVVGVPEPATTVCATGDNVSVVVFGPVYGFSGLTAGTVYYVSSGAAGDIVTPAPSGAGTWSWPIGYAEDAETLFVMPGVLAPTSNS